MGLEPLFLLQKQVLAYMMLHLSSLFLLEPSEHQNTQLMDTNWTCCLTLACFCSDIHSKSVKHCLSYHHQLKTALELLGLCGGA